ncbi:hypothetical protein MTO96_025973 [Rhipicephalus appendiculatus]
MANSSGDASTVAATTLSNNTVETTTQATRNETEVEQDTTPTTTASSDTTTTATQSPQANTTEKTSNSTRNATTTADLSSNTEASSDTTTSTPTAQENTTMETSNSTKPSNTTTDLTANTTAPPDTTTTTTQATLEKNTTEEASNYTEPVNITEGVNVSVSVYFFYDFEFEMQAYNRDQGDCKDIKMYLQALLASAELRFQHLKNGSLEFLFAGLNLLKRHELENIRVMEKESLTVSTLYMFKRFIQQKYQRLQQSTDIFVYISNRTMISEFDGTNASFGYAYQSGICTGSNVAVVRDSAVSYTGSAALAQKIALLLGASWDMNSTTEGMHERRCQEDMFRNITFKRNTTAKCLNKTGTLPGKYKLPSAMFLSREYCRSYYYTNPNVQDCSKEQQSAAYLSDCQVCCSNTTLLEGPVIGTVAPDGLKCGENKQICIGGECVHDPRLSVTRTNDSGI